MSPWIIQLGLLIMLLIADVSTATLIKLYQQSGMTAHWQLILTILIYCLVPVIILFSLKYEGIGNTNLYWNVLSTIFVYILAVLYFGEKVTNMQCLGVFLAVVGVLLIIYNK